MATPEGWPVARATDTQIGNPDSSVGIATLWTQREQLAPVVDPESYLIMGQLYTAAGVSHLLRNVMAHPGIRHLVICGADLQNTGEALTRIWQGQIGDNHQVIGIDKMSLEPELPHDAIARLAQRVQLHDKRDWNNARLKAELGGYIRSLPSLPPQGEPELYPIAEVKVANTFPSEQGVHVVRGKTIGQAWLRAIREVMMFGEELPTIYGEPSKDLTNLVTVVTDEDPHKPIFEDFFTISPEHIQGYMDAFMNADIPDGILYSYGERLLAFPNHAQAVWEDYRSAIQQQFGLDLPDTFQLGQQTFRVGASRNINQADIIVAKLKRVTADRGAIAMLYDPARDNQINIDNPQWKGFRNPCYVSIQAAIKSDKVYLTALSRSNDMWGAWVDNAFGLRRFQAEIADKVGYPMGPLITISSSGHIYQHGWDLARKVLEQNQAKLHGGFEADPRGVFQLRVEGKQLVVTHSDSETSQQLQPDLAWDLSSPIAAETIGMQIDRAGLLSQTGHGLYLGKELAYVHLAAQAGLDYTQGDPGKLIAALKEMAQKAKEYDQLIQTARPTV